MAVAGTVAGDIHEIGKTIVCSMLSAAGFEVTDVGCDVAPEAFVAKVRRSSPTSCCSRALLTTTMPNQQKTIEALKAAGLRENVKVMIGGAPRRAPGPMRSAPTATPKMPSRPWRPPKKLLGVA